MLIVPYVKYHTEGNLIDLQWEAYGMKIIDMGGTFSGRKAPHKG